MVASLVHFRLDWHRVDVCDLFLRNDPMLLCQWWCLVNKRICMCFVINKSISTDHNTVATKKNWPLSICEMKMRHSPKRFRESFLCPDIKLVSSSTLSEVPKVQSRANTTYSQTCLKRPLKYRQNKSLKDKW